MDRDFIEYLDNDIILFDGGMGTEIYRRGYFINKCYDGVTLDSPDTIKEIHKDFIEAGAQAIETNTFGANRNKLKKYGLAEKTEKLNKKSAEIAKEVAQGEVWVVGAVGPLRGRLAPLGEISEENARDIFTQQITALASGGVDAIILETFNDINEVLIALNTAKEVTDLPVIAQMTINEEEKTIYGTPPKTIATKLSDAGADVVGLNCTIGPSKLLPAIEKMVKVTDTPVSVMPNAGLPKKVDGRNIYLSSPEYMAEYSKRFVQAGAKVVGGCCGTQPDHIKEMNKFLKSATPKETKIEAISSEEEDEKVEPIPSEEKSNFARKVVNGEFVTSVELVPPRGIDTSKAMDTAKELSKHNIDTINIPDGPRAMTRMGALYIAKLFIDEIGIEPILHYTARDKNLLGIMSDFLGIQSLGIKNLLLITGDPPKMGDYPDATAVFDVDSIGLLNVLNNMNQGVDIGGNSIGGPTEYFLGAGVNPGAIEMGKEINNLEKKVDAGAEYAITQPIFDIESFRDFQDRIKDIDIPIIAGVWPLVSIKNAEFMNNELPEVSISDDIMKRMKNTNNKEEALNTGIEIAKDTIREIKDEVSGVQVSMPFGKPKYPIRVLEVLKNN